MACGRVRRLQEPQGPRPTLAHTDPGSVFRRTRIPDKNFGRTSRRPGEKQQRILAPYHCAGGVTVDQDDGLTEMSNAKKPAIFDPIFSLRATGKRVR